MKFKTWLENQTAIDVQNAFDSLGSGLKDATANKQSEYAKRIIAGEKPEIVLQGINPQGQMWALIMQKVAELKGQNNQGQNNQGQISLSSLASKITDLNWHSLYEIFERRHNRQPNNTENQKLGQTLYQAAQSNNMSLLAPYMQYIKAQRIN